MNCHLDRISVVLHRPIQPGNVGSVARAMKNMGLAQLRLVSPCEFKTGFAEWMAVSAKEILENAQVFRDLESALKGSNRVIGTVPPDRPRFQKETFSPRTLARRLGQAHPKDRISILFGPEDNGLSNDDLDFCHEFVCIPSHPDYPSLNLAQAVMVVAYEIFTQSAEEAAESLVSKPLAQVSALEQMYQHLEQTLLSVEFLDPANAHHMMRDLRRMLGRAQLDEREVRIVRGILRQVNWAVRNKDSGKP